MDLPNDEIRNLEKEYGVPRESHIDIVMDDSECELVRMSARKGRNHDVTVFIFKGNRLILIKKHSYPDGVYRAPSGGINEGESVLDGINREIFEETGTIISLKRYLLRVYARFICGDEVIPWVSHVFQARYVEGDMIPRDKKEIAGIKLATIEEMQSTIRNAMLADGRAGFKYRVFLTDEVVKEMYMRSNPSTSNRRD